MLPWNTTGRPSRIMTHNEHDETQNGHKVTQNYNEMMQNNQRHPKAPQNKAKGT